MAVVEEILRSEADGSISFGNHKLAKKAKVEDYEHAGDLLKPECRTGSSRGSTCEDRRGVKAHCKGVQTRRIL